MKKTKNIAFEKLKLPLYIATVILLALFFITTSMLTLYEWQNAGKVYPAVKADGISLSLKTKEEVRKLFDTKSASFAHVTFSLHFEGGVATVSAAQIGLGYNAPLIADQAYSVGRTGNIFADLSNKGRAWFGELNLPPSYSLNRQALEASLSDVVKKVNVAPIDAIFEVKGGRVVAFRLSKEGQEVDVSKLEEMLLGLMPSILSGGSHFELTLPVRNIKPAIALEDTNKFGIRERIASGTSRFRGSIQNRVHNIALSASRIDGRIIKPGEVFSFNEAVGDVSKLTGYKEAYIIKDGKTILGDGGGVCQVSTTLFRATLNAGLPIIERHPHSYRVSYYEQDSPPGFDATVYAPSYDLKFRNDTDAAILIEAYTDIANATLVFDLYGTSDGRKISLSKPIVTGQVPPPEDQYLDDPTLPKGVVKQIDFKAAGAKVSFSRTIEKDSNVLAAESFKSTYRPWQAMFLRGTKED